MEVLVEVEQEVKRDLSEVDDLLDLDSDLVDLSVLVPGDDDGVAVPSGEEPVVEAGGLPLLGVDDLLGLVVDVVDGGEQALFVLVLEGVVDGGVAHTPGVD